MPHFRNCVAPRFSRQILGIALAWFLAALLARHVGAAQRPGAADPVTPAREQQPTRMREGVTLNSTGVFKVTADRAVFTTEDGTARYSGLENLNLERIAIAVAESPDQLLWSVTGTVTEFRGANYLLVTRAMLKSKADPPAKSAASGEPNKISISP